MSVNWNPALIDGPIFVPSGYVDAIDEETGETFSVPTGVMEGYRLNTTAAELSARPDLEAWRVTPSHLARVWAGDDPENPTITVALLFADEAEAVAVLGVDYLLDPAGE
jgi:hypothetical protein